MKKTILKKASILLVAIFMVLTTVIIVGGNAINIGDVSDSGDYVVVKSVEGTEIFKDLFDRYTMTCIPVFGYYRTGDTLRGCISADGGISWFVSGFNPNDLGISGSFLSPPSNPGTPMGPTQGDVGVSYTYSTSAIDPENDDVYFKWDWDDGTFSDWLGPYASGGTASASHSWSNSGQYCIKVKAKDSNGEESGWSNELCVNISGGGNNPPDRPSKPSGPSSGEPGVEYTYTTSTTDPDDDMVRYGWEWTGDNTVDSWTNYYNSGATCSFKLVFDSIGTYILRVMAEDEYGAQSGFSSALTIVISASCIDYKGFNCCPIGESTMLTEEGDNMIVSDMEDGDGFTVDIPISNDVYQCTVKDALGSSSVSFTGIVSGSFEGSDFSMEMTVGSNIASDSSGSSYGIYPVGFNGAASGAPSIIAWVKKDDCQGNWEIAFRKTCDQVSSLDLGYIEFPSMSLGIYPVGFNGTASGAPSIIMYPGDECGDVLWTWVEESVDRLDINALMVTYVHTCETCGLEYPLLCTCEPSDHAGFLNEFKLSVSGVSEITVSDMWARHNIVPTPGNINGPNSGKKGETYNFSITPNDSDDAYMVVLWDSGQGSDPLIDGIYPVGFQGSSSGAPSMIDWHSEDDGDFVVKVRAFDMGMGVSPWVTHEISIPKNKAINLQLFLQKFFNRFPFMVKILNQIII